MKNLDSLFRTVLECTSDCVFTVDAQWRLTYMNPRALNELDAHPEDIGRPILEVYPLLRESPLWPVYHRAMIEKAEQHVEAFVPRFGGWYAVHAAPTEDGIVVFFTNIHERKMLEQELKESEDRLKSTLDNIPQMVWSAQPDGSHDYFSKLWYEFTGVPEGSTDGEGWNDVFHPDDQERAWSAWRLSLATGDHYEIKYRLRHRTDGYRWVLGRAWPTRDEHGGIVRWYGSCTDIHDEVVAKQALQGSEMLYRGVLEASTDCIKILSDDGDLEFMNGPGRESMEIEDFEQMRGRPWPELWPSDTRSMAEHAVLDAKGGKPARFTGFCPTAGGSPRWWDVAVNPMMDEDGIVKRLLCISRDITAHRERAEQLEWTSDHDALTSLPNRRAFNARLQAAVLRAMRSGGSVGLLLMDLDNFKHINDTMGHTTGDELLRAYSAKLRQVLHDAYYLARLGGDEFAIIVESAGDGDHLKSLGKLINSCFDQPIDLGGQSVGASTSIGGALFPRDASCASELLKNADAALFAMKEEGRGSMRLFEDDLREDAQRIVNELALGRTLIAERLVVPFYQPKVDLKSGVIVGYEALLRWIDPVTGVQLPSTVAESFKNYELAASIGELMQRRVIHDIAQGRFSSEKSTRISINASPAEFLRDDYAERLLGLLTDASVDPARLEVEVTEQVFFERHARFVERALRELHVWGVRVSLDDFGTGYSSLSHLRDFPVDVLKIDMSFVQQISTHYEIRAIVCAVIELAKSLRIEVVAEGIETQSQLDMLVAMGCSTGQGYLFGRAKPVDNILKTAVTALAA